MVLWHPLLFPLAVLYTCVGAQANRRGRKWKRGICIKKSLFADTFSNPKNKQCISPSPSLPLLQVSGQFYWTQILIWFDLKGVACWGCEVRCLKGPKSHQVPVSLGDNGLPRPEVWLEGRGPGDRAALLPLYTWEPWEGGRAGSHILHTLADKDHQSPSTRQYGSGWLCQTEAWAQWSIR